VSNTLLLVFDRTRILHYLTHRTDAEQDASNGVEQALPLPKVQVHTSSRRPARASDLMLDILANRLNVEKDTLESKIEEYHTLEIDKVKWYRTCTAKSFRSDELEDCREPMHFMIPNPDERLAKKEPFWFAEFLGTFTNKAPCGEVGVLQ
jgi:hypothetical protein